MQESVIVVTTQQVGLVKIIYASRGGERTITASRHSATTESRDLHPVKVVLLKAKFISHVSIVNIKGVAMSGRSSREWND